MSKSHFSFRPVAALLIMTIGIALAGCSCSPETYSPPISEAVIVEVPSTDVTTTESTTELTTESTEESENTEAVAEVTETTVNSTTVTAKKKTTTTAISTTVAKKTTATTEKKTTTTTKPSTTKESTTTASAATTTTTKKSSAVWGSKSKMKSDCVSIAEKLGYEYDSSLNKSNGHWVTPTFSGAFTSSSALKADVKDFLETYQTVGYSRCNFIFESNGDGEFYIYIIVG